MNSEGECPTFSEKIHGSPTEKLKGWCELEKREDLGPDYYRAKPNQCGSGNYCDASNSGCMDENENPVGRCRINRID